MASLLDEFSSRGLTRGGILFLEPSDALELVREAEHRGIHVLGLDAFFIQGSETQPVLEHSIDLSSLPTSDAYRAARTHIQEREELGLRFEVVLN
jgi:hypothetical protein